MLKKHHRSFYDRYDINDALKFQDFKEFCSKFLASLKVRMLIQGNIIESRALYMTQLIITNMSITKIETSINEKMSEVYQIPLGCSNFKVKSLRQNDKNSVIKNYYQVGRATIQNESLSEFLVSVINEPLFDTLRSHEQLGYGVACTLRKNDGILGILITVEYQENKNSAKVIDLKIEKFLKCFYETLTQISDKDFAAVKRSMVSLKLVADTDLENEVNRNWEEIRNGENLFNKNELEALETEKLSKDLVVNFYENVFLSSKSTRKLSVQVTGDNIKNVQNCSFKDLNEFKQNLILIKLSFN